jgi:hypothetical protein
MSRTGRHGTTSTCSACNEAFCGVSAFDGHRYGKFLDERSQPLSDGRKCLSSVGMLAQGFTHCAYGKWSRP